jgi:hypothetical protein
MIGNLGVWGSSPDGAKRNPGTALRHFSACVIAVAAPPLKFQ